MGDCIAVWLIMVIIIRRWAQQRQAKLARLQLPKPVRIRRHWGILRATVWLATHGVQGSKDVQWKTCWNKAAVARSARKDYIEKFDFNIEGVLTWAIGPILVIAMTSLIGYEIHAFATLVLSRHVSTPIKRLLLEGCAMTIFSRLFVNYMRTSLTDPGRPQQDSRSSQLLQLDRNWSPDCGNIALTDVEMALRSCMQMPKCRSCNAPKPARCHHCKVCRRCVLKMDHHCPFVNNCIGLRNYHIFCIFLLDIVIACCFMLLTLSCQFIEVVRAWFHDGEITPHFLHVVAATIIPTVAGLVLTPFLFFHVTLILSNETTLEYMGRLHRRRKSKLQELPNQGHRQDVLQNFIDVCGAPPSWCHGLLKSILSALAPQYTVNLTKRDV